MKHYRIYKLSAPNGEILDGKDIYAPDDSAALQAAAEDEDCPVCEVWQGAERVGTVE